MLWRLTNHTDPKCYEGDKSWNLGYEQRHGPLAEWLDLIHIQITSHWYQHVHTIWTGRVLNKLQQWITFACVTMLLVSHGWSISIHKNIFISTMYGYQRTNTHIIFFEAVAKLKLVNHSYITRSKMLHYYVWLIIISHAYKEKLLFIYSQLTKEWGNKKFNSFPIKYNLKYNNSNTWLCWQLNKYQ